MRIIHIFFFTLLITKNLLGSNIFETYEYELNFSSNNINSIKEDKINEIKIKSFQNQIKKILTFIILKISCRRLKNLIGVLVIMFIAELALEVLIHVN